MNERACTRLKESSRKTNQFFAFDNLDFGQTISLSAVSAAVQSVAGVGSANVTTLRRMDDPADIANPKIVRDNIFVRGTEIAVIGNNLSQPLFGLLSVIGKGGFADQ